MPYYRVCLPLVNSPDPEDAKRLAVSVIKNMEPNQLIGFLESEEMGQNEIDAMTEEKLRADIEYERRAEQKERADTEGWEPLRE